MLWQRLTFGSLMITALVALFWLDGFLHAMPVPAWAPWWLAPPGARPLTGLIITLVWCVVVFLATRELGSLLRTAGHEPATNWACLSNIALGLAPIIAAAGKPAPAVQESDVLPAMFLAFAGAAVTLALRRRVENAVTSLALTLLMIIYLGVLGSYMPRLAVQGGSSWRLLYVLLVIKSCDIGAYFAGLAFGRSKLIEWLSPKKTWEGFWGGVGMSILVALVGANLVGPAAPQATPAPFTWTYIAVFGLLMGVVGQAGDLLESLMKRSLAVKDSGRVVPAFGGLLDILDSPLVCVPVAYWMMLK